MRPQLAKLHTIRQLAEMAGVPKRTMFWRIERLHRKHGGDWLVRDGQKVLINLARLKRAHPGLFAVQIATTDDIEALEERLVHQEELCADLRTRQNALAATVRELREQAVRLDGFVSDQAKRRSTSIGARDGAKARKAEAR